MTFEEKTLKENTIFNGRIITVRDDTVLLPNGKEASREVVLHNGGVCVAVLTPANEILLVKQFRYPYREELLEIPAGKLEKGEDPYAAGLRETEEETGVKPKTLHALGHFYPTPAYCNEIIHMYFADEYEVTKQHLDEDEFLSCEKVKLSDAVKMVMNGEIKDGKTQAAVLKLAVLKGVKYE